MTNLSTHATDLTTESSAAFGAVHLNPHGDYKGLGCLGLRFMAGVRV